MASRDLCESVTASFKHVQHRLWIQSHTRAHTHTHTHTLTVFRLQNPQGLSHKIATASERAGARRDVLPFPLSKHPP